MRVGANGPVGGGSTSENQRMPGMAAPESPAQPPVSACRVIIKNGQEPMDEQTNQVGVRPGDAERRQEPGATALGRGGRMSRQRKSGAVLRLLRGEDLETVSRELGVTAATLTGWHDGAPIFGA